MYALGPGIQKLRGGKPALPSEDLRVAVTFRRSGGLLGPIKSRVPLTLDNIKSFVPEEQTMNEGIKALEKLGFERTGRGRLSASMKCTKKLYEDVFKVKLAEFKLDPQENYASHSFYFPPNNLSDWMPVSNEWIDEVYIQWPHIYSGISPVPPPAPYYHLEVPKQVASHLNATPLHQKKIMGLGIRVVMIDTGFEYGSHTFFETNGYTSKVVLAGDVKYPNKDEVGHGTGQSANLFSLAPRVEFIGVKIGGKDLKAIFDIYPATMLEGFYRACEQYPDIISISGGFDLRDPDSEKQRVALPNSLKALEAEILYAIASGITVVVAAGNGNFSFPAMMPDVIAVGGVFVNKEGEKYASDMASAYDSKIYNRHVPDFCGLVGRQEDEDRYIMLPIPPGCFIDLLEAADPKSGTARNDGWAAFSGTSAAAPQIAGICALLKSKKRDLKPSEIKDYLKSTAIPVVNGSSNPKSSDNKKAQIGMLATGAGLVDAFRAWQAVK